MDYPMTGSPTTHQPQQSPAPPQSLAEMILSLDKAALMAKQLPTTIDQAQLHHIYTSLHQAHHHLSSFLSNTHVTSAPPPPEYSLSAAPGEDDDNEPMQVGDEDEVEENSKSSSVIDKVEEKFRECFIKNKRHKRPLSPTAAEEKRVPDDGFGGVPEAFDPHGSKLRALDLVYQFHA